MTTTIIKNGTIVTAGVICGADVRFYVVLETAGVVR